MLLTSWIAWGRDGKTGKDEIPPMVLLTCRRSRADRVVDAALRFCRSRSQVALSKGSINCRRFCCEMIPDGTARFARFARSVIPDPGHTHLGPELSSNSVLRMKHGVSGTVTSQTWVTSQSADALDRACAVPVGRLGQTRCPTRIGNEVSFLDVCKISGDPAEFVTNLEPLDLILSLSLCPRI